MRVFRKQGRYDQNVFGRNPCWRETGLERREGRYDSSDSGG